MFSDKEREKVKRRERERESGIPLNASDQLIFESCSAALNSTVSRDESVRVNRRVEADSEETLRKRCSSARQSLRFACSSSWQSLLLASIGESFILLQREHVKQTNKMLLYIAKINTPILRGEFCTLPVSIESRTKFFDALQGSSAVQLYGSRHIRHPTTPVASSYTPLQSRLQTNLTN